MAELLIERGADIEYKMTGGWRPLMAAAQEGGVATIEVLVNAGAWVNARRGRDRGWTALSSAVQDRELPIVDALLDAGADPTHAKETEPSTELHRDGEVVAVRRARYGVTACDIASGNLADLAPNDKLWGTSTLQRLCEPVLNEGSDE